MIRKPVDPKEYLQLRETLAVARLKRGTRELMRDARPQRSNAAVDKSSSLRWVKQHPFTALGSAAGLGFLLAPGARRKKRYSDQTNVDRITIAGQLMVMARLVDSVTRFVRGWPGLGTTPPPSSEASGQKASPHNGTQVPSR